MRDADAGRGVPGVGAPRLRFRGGSAEGRLGKQWGTDRGLPGVGRGGRSPGSGAGLRELGGLGGGPGRRSPGSRGRKGAVWGRAGRCSGLRAGAGAGAGGRAGAGRRAAGRQGMASMAAAIALPAHGSHECEPASGPSGAVALLCYFSSLSPMARKIMQDKEKIREKYGPGGLAAAAGAAGRDHRLVLRPSAPAPGDPEELARFPGLRGPTGQKVVRFGDEVGVGRAMPSLHLPGYAGRPRPG